MIYIPETQLTKAINIEAVENHLEEILAYIEADGSSRFSLIRGNLGKVLFYSYAYRYTSDIVHGEKAIMFLNHSLQHLLRGNIAAQSFHRFSEGFSGLGLIINQLKKEEIFDLNIESELAKFDKIIFELAVQEIKKGNVGYMFGSLSGVYYLSERAIQINAIEPYLEQLVDALYAVARKDERGISYINTFSSAQKPSSNDLVFNLNHGLCGILLVLMKIYQLGIRQNLIKQMVSDGIQCLLFYQRSVDSENEIYGYFPTCIAEHEPLNSPQNKLYYNSILGWCNGDLNQLLLLYRAGQLFNRPDWIELANGIGHNTAMRRSPEQSRLKNPYFCHGTAGVAHIYKRLFELSGQKIYDDTYKYWISETFPYISNTLNYKENAPNLFDGALGISLVFLNILSEEDLKWDNIFLL